MREFGSNREGKNCFFKQAGKKIDAVDQDQIIDGPGIGYNQPHCLKTKFLERAAFFLEIFQCVFLKNSVLLKKAVQFNPAQT